MVECNGANHPAGTQGGADGQAVGVCPQIGKENASEGREKIET
jgi:hypothetical protein